MHVFEFADFFVTNFSMATKVKSKYKHSAHRNVHIISLSFFLVFSGVNSALVFGTSDYGNYAAISLAILYASFGLSALFIVPYILNKNLLSPKYCAFFGSLVEILFISEYIMFINQYYLYFISILQGIGASMFWIGSQNYIMNCANYYKKQQTTPTSQQQISSEFQGIYFTFYASSTFVSNLLSAILFKLQLPNAAIYSLFTIICCFGCLIISFADDIKTQNDDSLHHKKYDYATFESSANNTTQIYSPWTTIKQWKDVKLQCLVFMSLYLGLFQVYEYGLFPLLVVDDSMKFFVMACYGISGAIFSHFFGKIAQCVNRWNIICVGLGINVFVFLVIYKIGNTAESIPAIVLFVIAFMNGIVESSLFITLFTLYPIINGDKPETLANNQFFQQIGLALGYVLFGVVGFEMKILIDLGVLSFACFVFFKSEIIRKYMNYKEVNQVIDMQKVEEVTVKREIIILPPKLIKDDMFNMSHMSDGYESTYSEI